MFKTSIAMMASLGVLASTPQINPNRIVVKLKAGEKLPQSKLISSAKELFNGMYILQTSNASKLKAEIENHQSISKVQFDYFSGRSKLPTPEGSEKLEKSYTKATNGFNDPGLRRLWGFKSTANNGMDIINAYQNFGSAQGEPVVVAVVDTGVDYNHEDLKDVMWVNEGEIPGNGIDDDGNGYVDDVHGINTLVRDSEGRATGDMMDKHSHGTHVSGTIGATQNNGTGIAGVASNVRIMGIRAVPNSGDETDVDVAESFIYAAKHGAKIINCSFGKKHNEGGMLVSETIEHIGKEYGVLVVAAAGNESSNNDRSKKYPASFENENLLVVASSTKRGRLSYFSNYGIKSVDVAAPGSSIYSTTPGNRYSNMSGTSMASPNTAGLAAEILARRPELSPVELKKVIMDTVSSNRRYTSKVVSGGLINLNSALE
jgi:subtilisin family serine protease